MHLRRAIVGFLIGLFLGSCIDPKCPPGYFEAGELCKRCKAGEARDGGACFPLEDASVESTASDPEEDSSQATDETDLEAQDGGMETDPVDYALGSAGRPCRPELEQTLACDGHASRRVLKCDHGTWTVLHTCPSDERCDSRAGTDQGTCASIPTICSERASGDTCEGDERVTCGADLIDVAPNPCPPYSQCRDSDPVRCECVPGFEMGDDTSCVDIDECAQANLCTTAYPCTQTAPAGYTCLGQFADWPMPDAVAGAKFTPSYDTTATPGVVIDNVTGLMWQRMVPGSSDKSMPWYEGCTGMRNVLGDACTWPQARRYCSDLVLAGESDWRLPSKIELESILKTSGVGPQIDQTVFPGTPTDSFWSSSPFVGYIIFRPFLPGDAWAVNFRQGISTDYTAIQAFLVRCVRSSPLSVGMPEGRYIIDSNNDTVTDTRTRLVWQRHVDSTFRPMADAESFCVARGEGWRLPSFKELLTLVDPTRAVDDAHAAIDPVAFPKTRLGQYISTSPRISNTASGRLVDFTFGTSSEGPDVEESLSQGLVRCVR